MAKKTAIPTDRKNEILKNCIHFLMGFEEADTLARKVLGNIFEGGEVPKESAETVLYTSLTVYCSSVIDGVNILEQKLKEKNADALFLLCNAQYK